MPPAPDLDELDLIRRSGVVLRVGRLSLSAGTGSYRVKASMARVARALGIDRHEAHVTLTEITTTSHRGPSFRTEVVEERTIGVNVDRLTGLEHLAGRLEARGEATVEEVTAELDRIAGKPPLYPVLANALWAAMACAAFSFLNSGGVVEVVGVFVGAFLGQALRRTMLHRGFNPFGVTMLCATVACLGYLGFVGLLQATGAAGGGHDAGYVSAVLFLIPGFPLVTGFLDLAKLDFSAGIARLTYALMILTSAALAVWALSLVVGLSPDPPTAPELDPGLLLTLRFVASFLGVLGFALMFNSPWRIALAAAGVGMVANVLRIELVESAVPPQAAAAIAALAVGLLAAVIAPRLDVPRITVYVPAVTIMVPGVLAYRAVFHISNGETVDALSYGVQAALVVASLAIGLAIARMLTDRTWAYER
ncbi:threonine/serine ThrE exporter family protein [Cellulomonas fengjieae]|uniref:Threonine/serine exporter family protein n=1 Tax=Cellulomonas fengjieae TaxID=2819978 RepID=A0ABS3SKB5_9CELL|nr:threonine/serine exporter family protein [Cellulomonas fengjieae]MBO3086191.1 threonine/serine exporter family protein [Cellulomonas fengjieae]QVI65754.1 threonine/serine exporter family protein [Cellulomonas fengjieae]